MAERSTGALVEARAASIETIRAAFPALERREGGEPVAYFDGPGGTQAPRVVVDAVAEQMLRHNGNTDWNYPTSHETDAMIADARAAFADFFHARADEVAFGANMTTITFHLARALARGWREGDEVVITELEHHANVAPWRALEQERGIRVRMAPFDAQTGELDMDALAGAVGERTRLVAVTGASNAIGTVVSVGDVARLAHDAGALCFVDAVHSAPHVLPDVRATDCDFLACSPYKFYGTHVGVLYGKHDLLASVDVPKVEPAPDTAPDRMEIGTQNFEGIAGARAAVEFLASLGDGATRRDRLRAAYDALHLRGEALFERLWNGLGEIHGVRLYGAPPGRPRTPTLAFTIEGVHPRDAAGRLSERGLYLSHGNFYAATVIERLGRAGSGGVIRAGCACYTSEDEVDRLIEGVRDLAR